MAGEEITLSWQSEHADECFADGHWSGSKVPWGEQVISVANEAMTFSLTCSGQGGEAVAMVGLEVLGSVNVNWQPPVENVDGSPVSGIASYTVHIGTESGVYDETQSVAGDQQSLALTVALGSVYVAMTATDLEGDISGLSNEVVLISQ